MNLTPTTTEADTIATNEAWERALDIAKRLDISREDVWTLVEGLFAKFTRPQLLNFTGVRPGVTSATTKGDLLDIIAAHLATELEIEGYLR